MFEMGLKNFKQLSSKVSDRKKFIALDECFFILVFVVVVVVVVCPFQKSLQRISSTFLRPLLRPLLRFRRAVDNYKDGFSMWSILLNYYCFLILRLYANSARPELPKFCHFGQILNVVDNFWSVLCFWEISNVVISNI